MIRLAAALLAAFLLLAPAAHATPNNHNTHQKAGKHKAKHKAKHAKAGGHDAGGDHGDGKDAAHHVDYAADDDGDGTPNWRDPTDDLSGEPNESYVVVDVISHGLNLALLLGFIVWVLRRPLTDALRHRALIIRKELTDSARERDEAQQAFDELETRLSRFEEEVAAMKADAAEHARNEEAKLIEHARAHAERIGQAAQRTVSDEVRRARAELRRDAVELAIELAQRTLVTKVTDAHQQKLARAFLDTLDDQGGAHV